MARWLFLRMLQSAVHRSRPSSAYPRHVSWVPLGPVLEGIVHRTTFERWELIEELACLARHCDWGVEGVRGHGAVRYRFKYFSSMAPLHDPTAGLAPTWWKPTARSTTTNGPTTGNGDTRRPRHGPSNRSTEANHPVEGS